MKIKYKGGGYFEWSLMGRTKRLTGGILISGFHWRRDGGGLQSLFGAKMTNN